MSKRKSKDLTPHHFLEKTFTKSISRGVAAYRLTLEIIGIYNWKWCGVDNFLYIA